MIYLFDDNQFGQMSKNYGFDVVEHILQDADIITHIAKSLDDNGLDTIFQKAKAIFIHDSFPPKDFKERVCYMAKEKGLPLVVFTGGEAVTIWDKDNVNIISKIKKDRFYHYLIPFLEIQKENPNEPILVRKLVFGKNYEIEKSLIIQDRLGSFLRGRLDMFRYESDFIGGTEEYKDLIELFYFIFGERSEDEFAKFDDKYLERPCSAKEFFLEVKNMVSQIIAKYE